MCLRLPSGWPCRNFVTPVSRRKLERWGIRRWKNGDDTWNYFTQNHIVTDGWTDGQTYFHSKYCSHAWHREGNNRPCIKLVAAVAHRCCQQKNQKLSMILRCGQWSLHQRTAEQTATQQCSHECWSATATQTCNSLLHTVINSSSFQFNTHLYSASTISLMCYSSTSVSIYKIKLFNWCLKLSNERSEDFK